MSDSSKPKLVDSGRNILPEDLEQGEPIIVFVLTSGTEVRVEISEQLIARLRKDPEKALRVAKVLVTCLRDTLNRLLTQ